MPVNFVFAYACSIAQRYCQRKAPIWKYGKSTCDSACPQDQLVTVKRQKGNYASFSVLFNILKKCFLKDSVFNTSTITAVSKSSMKPRSGATTNCHLCGSEERNGEQRKALVEQ